MARRKRQPKQTFDDHMGLSSEEVLGILKFFRIPEKEFTDWIYGQTCPMIDNGKIGYYYYDIHRFVKWKLGGPVPTWD